MTTDLDALAAQLFDAMSDEDRDDWIDKVGTALTQAHAAGVAQERARVVGLIGAAQRKELMTTAENMGYPIAVANALNFLLMQVRQ